MKTSRLGTLAALPLAAVLALAGCAPDGGMPGGGPGASQDAGAMADVMFVQMMIPHHEQAIEMSDMLLAKDGIDPEVAALAQQIKDAQAPEIELMTGWLEEWGMPSHPDMDDMGGMDHGDGMMSQSDMDALKAAQGDEASRLFLEQMIEHHAGAVDMAEDVVDDGSDPDVRALAETIIQTQTAEIEQMERMLGQLP